MNLPNPSLSPNLPNPNPCRRCVQKQLVLVEMPVLYMKSDAFTMTTSFTYNDPSQFTNGISLNSLPLVLKAEFDTHGRITHTLLTLRVQPLPGRAERESRLARDGLFPKTGRDDSSPS